MRHKTLIGITCFIPTLIGIIFWNNIPEQVPMYFNMYRPNKYVSKSFFLFGFPLFMFSIYLVLTLVSVYKPNWVGGSKKLNKLIQSIPFLTFFCFLLILINSNIRI